MKKLTLITAICLVFFMAGSAAATPICGQWIRPPGSMNLVVDCNFNFVPPVGAMQMTSICNDPYDNVTPYYNAVMKANSCTATDRLLPVWQRMSTNEIVFERTVQDYNAAGIGTMTFSAAGDWGVGAGGNFKPLDTAHAGPPPGPAVIKTAKLVCVEVLIQWSYAASIFPGYTGIAPCVPDTSYTWTNLPNPAVQKNEFVWNRWVGVILDSLGAETDYRVVFEWTQYPAGPPNIVCPGGQITIPQAFDSLLLSITKVLPGDINGDGIVDINDYLLLSGNWLQTKDNCHTSNACAPIATPK